MYSLSVIGSESSFPSDTSTFTTGSIAGSTYVSVVATGASVTGAAAVVVVTAVVVTVVVEASVCVVELGTYLSHGVNLSLNALGERALDRLFGYGWASTVLFTDRLRFLG